MPASTPPRKRLAVIGTPRGGLRTASVLLTEAGLPCGHEEAYHWGVIRDEAPRWAKPADASWLAVPILPQANVAAIHVARHPLDAIASIIDCGLLDVRAFVRWAAGLAPAVSSRSPVRAAAAWWLAWTQRCRALTGTCLRVEDLTCRRFNRTRPDRRRGAIGWDDLPDGQRRSVRDLAVSLGYGRESYR